MGSQDQLQTLQTTRCHRLLVRGTPASPLREATAASAGPAGWPGSPPRRLPANLREVCCLLGEHVFTSQKGKLELRVVYPKDTP